MFIDFSLDNKNVFSASTIFDVHPLPSQAWTDLVWTDLSQNVHLWVVCLALPMPFNGQGLLTPRSLSS